MIAALRAWWHGWQHLKARGYLYIWASVAWAILTLLIVTAPAACAGMARLAYLASREPTVSWSDFWDTFREHIGRGLGLALVHVLVVVVNVVNILAYRDLPGTAAALLRAVWTLTLVVWLGLQFYLWPLYVRMERPTIVGALRNAALMMALNPLFTVTAWSVAALLVVLSVVLTPAWLLLLGGLLASGANALVRDRLVAAGLEQPIVEPALAHAGENLPEIDFG